MHVLLNKSLLILVICLGIFACKSSDKLVPKQGASAQAQTDSQLASMLKNSDVFLDNFTGFELYDPESEQIIYAQNEKRYFTPASNTKLFTFYTGLKLLPDRLPGLKYVEHGDSLIIWGTGDPSFLRSDLDNNEVYHFLKNHPGKIYYSDSHYRDNGLGPGWSWSDYQYAYSAEKSPFPMYGNMVRFSMEEVTRRTVLQEDSVLQIDPPYFRALLVRDKNQQPNQPVLFRKFADNTFQYHPEMDTSRFTINKPYHYTPQLVVKMLSDTLGTSVEYVEQKPPKNAHILYSIPADTAYKKMLQPSDNFIAEQLLLATAAELEKPLDSEIVIDKMKETHLSDMPDEPQWVDGSGLSRYNMFTPRSMIWLLQKIDAEFESDQKLFELLAAGGESGTIRNWYAARDGGGPYVFAKTGTLSNNHCLSGFVITETGRKLLFSFMNNHYVTSSSVVKEEMEKILWFIHKNY